MGIYAMTGGATGIGAAIKEQLRAEGHEVVVVDIKDADIVADLSMAEGRQAAIDGILARAPEGLDGFVPCAGLGPVVKPASLVAKVNYFGSVVMVQGLKDAVAKKGGAIVMISSNSAPMGADEKTLELMLAGDEAGAIARVDELGDGQNAYGGSKLALTRWMRRNTTEYAHAGVRINAIAPGHTQTPLTEKVESDPQFGQLIKDFAATIPIGRSGRPEDIANAVCFMLSDKASFMAGSVIFVDGGHDAMLRPDQF
ncbi:MAG: SDR family oxidoreductase [Pseudomonadales bacterium]